jgi:hypothetical protein
MESDSGVLFEGGLASEPVPDQGARPVAQEKDQKQCGVFSY